MTEWFNNTAYSIGGAMLIMMALGIVFSACMPALGKWNKRYFITLFSMLLLYVIAIFTDLIIYTDPDMAATEKAVIICEFLLFSALSSMPMFFLLHSCGESINSSVLFRVITVLWGIFCLTLFFARFKDVFYKATTANQYIRGPLYALLLIPLELITASIIAGLIRRRKKLSKRVFIALLVYLLPIAIAIIVYMLYPVDILVSLTIAFCAVTMLVLILTENLEQYMRHQREIANQRAGILVLQMRPHFICNTMMSIYYLCDRDPQKAKQVTLDFTSYLRKNFAAIASEETIPFSSELEHTRAYLAVEQAQFEDTLFVNFDTPYTMFRIPPLTLQPIVENAVKHGMKSSNDPIHISVITRQTDKASEIIVEDDGPGFSPVDDNEPHIALNNIRQRLKLMCNGKLLITQREGGGTSVKVIIPHSDR